MRKVGTALVPFQLCVFTSLPHTPPTVAANQAIHTRLSMLERHEQSGSLFAKEDEEEEAEQGDGEAPQLAVEAILSLHPKLEPSAHSR